MRERGSARYFIQNNSCPTLINSHWSFPSLFFYFSSGLNRLNYFFDVVLTERLECFKNISMFCGMKVRLQKRLFSLSLDEADKLKVRSAVAWKNFSQLACSQRQWYSAGGDATAGVTPVILPMGWWFSPMRK